MFKIGLDVNTFATNVKVFVPPIGIADVVPINVPAVLTKSLELTNCKPAGNTSFTSTFVAISGPALLTVIV